MHREHSHHLALVPMPWTASLESKWQPIASIAPINVLVCVCEFTATMSGSPLVRPVRWTLSQHTDLGKPSLFLLLLGPTATSPTKASQRNADRVLQIGDRRGPNGPMQSWHFHGWKLGLADVSKGVKIHLSILAHKVVSRFPSAWPSLPLPTAHCCRQIWTSGNHHYVTLVSAPPQCSAEREAAAWNWQWQCRLSEQMSTGAPPTQDPCYCRALV